LNVGDMLSGAVAGLAGDVNGDGFPDLVVGSRAADPGGRIDAGEAYVIYGQAGGLPPATDVRTLTQNRGVTLQGVRPGDLAGVAVSMAGDVDGDGFGDVLIGATEATFDGMEHRGEAYLVYGGSDPLPSGVRLDQLGDRASVFPGIGVGDYTGWSIAAAGDINGDGQDDIIIDAHRASPDGRREAGGAYVVFGSQSRLDRDFALEDLDGSNGFRINGVSAGDFTGKFVAGIGDINGDGIDDLALGAYYADPDGRDRAGEVHVVFGRRDGFDATIELGSLDEEHGFRIPGLAAGDNLGKGFGGAGDVNGDGVDDLIIGAPQASRDGRALTGEAYVIFGNRDGFSESFDLRGLDGTNGFRMTGQAADDQLGFVVGGAGDMNGDGRSDIYVSAHRSDVGAGLKSGAVHVIYGRSGLFGPTVDPAALYDDIGFTVGGGAAGDQLGKSVARAGDLNADGSDDLAIAAIATRTVYIVNGWPTDTDSERFRVEAEDFGLIQGFSVANNPVA